MKNLSKKLNKFLSLSFVEKFLFLKTGFVLIKISVLLKILPFNLFRLLFNFSLRFPVFSALKSSNQLLLNYTTIWANMLHISCLPQALVVKYFLRNNQGIHLIIGVNNGSGSLNAHAWVEQNGRYLIGDRPFEQYTPLWTWQ